MDEINERGVQKTFTYIIGKHFKSMHNLKW